RILPIAGAVIVVGILLLAVLVALDAQLRVELADDAVLGVVDLAAAVAAERLGDGALPALRHPGAAPQIDRQHDELALRLGGGRAGWGWGHRFSTAAWWMGGKSGTGVGPRVEPRPGVRGPWALS